MPVSVKMEPRSATNVIVNSASNTYSSYYNNNFVSSGFHSTRYTDFDISHMRGANIIGFRKLKRDGALLPETPFTQYFAKGKLEPCTYAIRTVTPPTSDYVIQNYGISGAGSFGTTYEAYGQQVPTWCRSESELEELVDWDEASYWRQKAAARLYNSGHDTLTFLAELHKVRNMFLSRARRLADTRNRPIEKHLKDKPGDWLESRYGWRTLLFDLEDLNKALTTLGARMSRVSERTGGKTSWSDESSSPYTHTAVSGSVTRMWTTTIQYRGHITADFSPSSFRFNPITTAWELLPYSFIIDWFIGVGQSLEALSFLTLSNDHTSSFGVRVDVEEKWVGTVSPRGPTYISSPKASHDVNWTAEASFVLVRRVPGPVSSIPQTKLRLDTWKVFDLLAILYQKLR